MKRDGYQPEGDKNAPLPMPPKGGSGQSHDRMFYRMADLNVDLMEEVLLLRRFRSEALQALRAVFEPPEVGRCQHGYADSSRSVMGYREARQWYMENRDA